MAAIRVVRPDGREATIDESELAIAQKQGYRQLTPELSRQRHLEETRGGLLGTLASAATGAGRGIIPFGGYDAALVAGAGLIGGPEEREFARQELKNLQEVNPIASAAGEIGGFGLQAALLPVSRVAEGAVELGLGAGNTALGTIGRKAIGGAVGGALEGSIVGGSQAASQAVLDDDELTAEKLLAAMGHGAEFGGLMGAGLGAVGGAVKYGSRKLGGALASSLVDAGDSAMLADNIQGAADSFAGDASGAALRFTKKANRYFQGMDSVGGVVMSERKNLEKLAGKDFKWFSHAEAAEVAGKRVQEIAEQEISPIIKSAASKGDAAVDAVKIAKRIEDEVAKPHMQAAATAENAVPVRRFINDLLQNNGLILLEDGSIVGKPDMNLEKLWIERRGLDKKINFNPNAVSLGNQDKQAIRRIMQDEIDKAVERGLGEEGLTKYRDANNRYAKLRLFEDAASDKAARLGANAPFGLRDMGAAGAGLIAGNPAVGAAMGLGSKFVRERGDFIAAGVLDDLAKSDAIKSVGMKVNEFITSGVQEFLEGTAPKTMAVLGTAGRAAKATVRTAPVLISNYEKRQQWFEEEKSRVTSPTEMQTHRVMEQLAPLGVTAPGLVATVTGKAANGITALQGRIPTTVVADTIFALDPEMPISDTEMSAYMKYAEGVKDPLSLIKDMRKRQIDAEKVDAVKQVFPKLFAKIQEEVIQQIAAMQAKPKGKKKKDLSYDQKTQLYLLFGVPADGTFDPKFIAGVQQTYKSANNPAQAKPGAAPDVAKMQLTDMQRVEGM